jgi:hypothetical protein
MKSLNYTFNPFTCDAIVGNIVSVLIIVILVLLKPAGATMV